MQDAGRPAPPVWLRSAGVLVLVLVALSAGYAVAIAVSNLGRIGV